MIAFGITKFRESLEPVLFVGLGFRITKIRKERGKTGRRQGRKEGRNERWLARPLFKASTILRLEFGNWRKER